MCLILRGLCSSGLTQHLRPSRWNLHNMCFLSFMPTGRIHFVFDTGLMVCLRDDTEDGELQVSFEGSLRWQLAVEGVQSLLFLASQIQNEHSIEDLLNFLIVFLIRVLLKPSFLKQHKTDIEQYPLLPTSTAKSSTHQPLDSIIVFKAKYCVRIPYFLHKGMVAQWE